MNIDRESVIRMAQESSNKSPDALIDGDDLVLLYLDELERFAALVAAAATEEANRRANASWTLMCEKMVASEREECAKVCDLPDGLEDWEIFGGADGRSICNDLAAAIRARGKT